MVSRRAALWPGIFLSGLALCSACTSVGMQSAPSAAPAARQAFELALLGYEQENLKPLEALLPAGFVGRSLLLDAARTTLNQQKQIKINLSEVSYQAVDTPINSVVISAQWEKRFLKLPALVPTLESGTLQALMHIEAGQWVLDSLSTDNPLIR